jgi:hypothetical protein
VAANTLCLRLDPLRLGHRATDQEGL